MKTTSIKCGNVNALSKQLLAGAIGTGIDKEEVAGFAGAGLGTVGSVGTVVAVGGGTSAAAITSGLATVGGLVGGGMLAGIGIAAFLPVAVGFGLYKLFKD